MNFRLVCWQGSNNASTKQAQQTVRLRPGAAGDAEVLGQICYEAFRHISEAHGFPPDFPSAEPAIGLMQMMLGNPHIYSVVAENGNGDVAGSNFLWELDTVSGVGPITIDPEQQNSATGRKLMVDVFRRSDERGFPAIRLCQATYHNRSLALYTKLGRSGFRSRGGCPPRRAWVVSPPM